MWLEIVATKVMPLNVIKHDDDVDIFTLGLDKMCTCNNHMTNNFDSKHSKDHNLTGIAEGGTLKTPIPSSPTSSTLLGGQRGAGPSSLHTTLEGPT